MNNIVERNFKTSIKDRDEIAKIYLAGITIKEICHIYRITKASVYYILDKRKVKIRPNRRYFFNQSYFAEIDSPDKAYFLGLLFSDGGIFGNNISLLLQISDRDILEKFKSELKYYGELKIVRFKYCKLLLCSKKMCYDLKKLGCTTKKSLTLKFPTKNQVPVKFLRHFIRGCFDGDGSIYLNIEKYLAQIDIAGSSFFCEKLKKVLEDMLSIHITLKKIKNIYSCKINGNRQVIKFLHFIYQDTKCFLERKYDKYTQFKKIYRNRILNHPKYYNDKSCYKFKIAEVLSMCN